MVHFLSVNFLIVNLKLQEKFRQWKKRESIMIVKSSESIGGAALIRGWRLLTFLSQMRSLFEGGAYSSTGKYDIGSVLVCSFTHSRLS